MTIQLLTAGGSAASAWTLVPVGPHKIVVDAASGNACAVTFQISQVAAGTNPRPLVENGAAVSLGYADSERLWVSSGKYIKATSANGTVPDVVLEQIPVKMIR